MQIFDAADPVAAGQPGLHASAGDPAEAIGGGNAVEALRSGLRRTDDQHTAVETLPAKTRGTVEQPIVRRRPAQPAANRSKIGDAGRARRTLHAGKAGRWVALDIGAAEIEFEAGD